jgi:uncharacterized protein YjiS (DUF1127 family)
MLAHPPPVLVNSSQTQGAGDATSSASGRSPADIGARGRLSRAHNNVMALFLSVTDWKEMRQTRYLLESVTRQRPLAASFWDNLCLQEA